MKMTKATIRAVITKDGLVELQDRVKIGDVFYVDLDRMLLQRWGKEGTDIDVRRISIWADEDINGQTPGWIPVELLDIPKDEVK